MVTCYVGLGSNLGDREYNIRAAIRRIKLLMNTRVTRISKIIETPPEGGPPQGPYLNCVIEIQTTLPPYELLKRLQKLEDDLGRIRTVKDGPRCIDLDILLYADARIEEESLCIPHPRMLERKFVMEPLEEIAPDAAEKLKIKKAIGRKVRQGEDYPKH
ncbi:MAG: 2-amino-4-hydroxy-6-hydroxymethyldihydropteridine diphosphokinase [Candidatus Omnitrophota bacterium]